MEEKNKKISSFIMPLSLLLTIIILGVLVYMGYKNGYFASIWKTSDNESNSQTQENIFTGQTVKTTLPTGWSMKEYYNGEGSDYLVEGTTYSGLTGIKIFDNNNQELFSLQAISGIGFEGCTDYYQFVDDDPSYKTEMQSLADQIGDTMTVNDYSSKQYVQLNILGNSVRRVDTDLFFDEKSGDSYFEASCFKPLLTLDGLYFTYEDGTKGYGYFYEYSSGITNQVLEQIDTVLNSISLVK